MASPMAVYNHWTGLVDLTGGLTLQIAFMLSIIPLITPSSFKELVQTVHMHPHAGYYLVLNGIIPSRLMHMNWYILASRQVSLLALNFDEL